MFNYIVLFFSALLIACNFQNSNDHAPIQNIPLKETIDSSGDLWLKNIDYTLADSFKISKLKYYSNTWNEECFPMPVGKLLLRNYQGEAGYDYLTSNFDSSTSKISTEKERSAGIPCSWKQNFKSGFIYAVNNCIEGSTSYEINTSCTDKQALVRLVDVLFYKNVNNWDVDSSNYSPILEGHGDYFSIEKNHNGSYDLKYTTDE